jgi:hypothetical protein
MNTTLAVQQQHSISDMERMAKIVAGSRLFGVNNDQQALALMLLAQSEGRHPASIANEYHIIQNKPSLKANVMLSRFQQAGGSVEWHTYEDDCVSATFSHPQGGKLKVQWDNARAKKAGLLGKDNWSKFPRQMLRSRVVSEGVQSVYPGVLSGGMYTPEEVQFFDSPAPAPAPAALPAAVRVVEEVIEAVEEIEDPVTPDLPWYTPLEDMLSDYEEVANAFLLAKGKISDGHTWRAISDESYRSRILENPQGFLKAIKGGAAK